MTTKANLCALLKKAQNRKAKKQKQKLKLQTEAQQNGTQRDLTPPQHWDAAKRRTTSARPLENVTLSVYEKPFDPYLGKRHLAEYRVKFLTQVIEA